MSTGVSPLRPDWVLDAVADLIRLALERTAEAARTRQAPPPRRGAGATLRPGPETELWNALVDRIRPHLRRYGRKAVLARELGVPRQRVHDWFKARTRLPDAERTLRILTWVIQQESPAELVRRTARRPVPPDHVSPNT